MFSNKMVSHSHYYVMSIRYKKMLPHFYSSKANDIKLTRCIQSK